MMRDQVILFTRWPQAGRTKTRLIPALGADGAAALHRRMALHTAGRAWAFCAATDRCFVVAHEGGAPDAMRGWLGRVQLQEQTQGDLGARMMHAMLAAHARGANKIIVIGSDCPGLDAAHLDAAFGRLGEHDVVLGPAGDGGYYLIGMSAPQPDLLHDVPWGTGQVLAITARKAEALGLRVALLPVLSDVDEAADIAEAEAALAVGRSVSVVIPAWNDAEVLEALLPRVMKARPLEVLVADGGSTDDTAAIALRHGAVLVASPQGRAAQMNAAAREARGEFLLFLHADTTPPERFSGIVADALARPGVAAGAFRFALREKIAWRRLVEIPTRLRGLLLGRPYGDQGLFLRRDLFQRIGGFPDWPILEDVELLRRLRRLGGIVITRECAPTSARRWMRGGLLRTFLRHQLIMLGYALGARPEKLASIRQRGS